MPSNDSPPKQAAAETTAHLVLKGAMSTIPGAGAVVSYLLDLPLQRRKDKWLAGLAERLSRVEDRLEDLQNDEQFITATLHASVMAMRTHQALKLEALRNAVLNVAVGQAPDEIKQHLFLTWIDAFNETHLRILKVFQNPEYETSHMTPGSLKQVLEASLPDLAGQADIYNQLWRDLHIRGLVNTEGLQGLMTGSGLTAKRTTDLGDEFLQFISEPPL